MPSAASDTPRLAIVVVAYDSADDLAASLPRVRAQMAEGDELVVVDNASSDATAERAGAWAQVVRSERNRGFAGGCRLGADATTAPLVLFLNPDAVPAAGCLDALRAAAADHPDWGAWQATVTMDGGATVNTAGNVVHFLGIGWAGGYGRPAASVGGDRECGFPSGAALVVRREAWDALDGFDERYFMYGEDLDLGLRLWLGGWRCGVATAAVVEHDYTFAKGDYKWFYLERNRWWTVLGAYPLRLLLLLAPALLAFEVALLAAALAGGWLRPKLRAQAAVLRELPAILRRRRRVQAGATIAPGAFAAVLEASLDSPFLGAVARVPGVAAAQRAYYRLVRGLL
jgi:N-acetylglucosaminyl-diphospho-decaprenol L-rhamnosyltransferase